ncbi:MAG: sulfur carrier protein ThiS [Gemmatimonadetes bacterium]|nr:sulfur carrier protein ThiS [Gemmatimonadota bacterium]
MQLLVNGRHREVEQGTDLLALLRSFDMDPRLVVIEHNDRILRPAQFEGAVLAEGDRVEIVQFVGGG